ncbi:cobalamin-dependent protein [Spirillospora sp. NPDC047279]|uniref:cobalamin B12-binding domain-containing protein n=1 Tax=Spirillospora sp. NPDC047279 TaxID=3155478 RepID=UPI0033F81273
MIPPAGLEQHVDDLWKAMVDGDEHAATDAALAAVDAGCDVESLLLNVIAPLQERVGVEWAADRMTVVQEHIATAICERTIAVLAHRPSARPGNGGKGRIMVTCTDGEWHALPARLLATVLRLRGWQVDYLGAQMPIPHLIMHLHRIRPDVVALSSSIATRLPTAHSTVIACQSIGIPALVGGAAYGNDDRYARLLGADGWARDARGVADGLADGRPDPPSHDHQPIDDLPHLADQEYTMVSRYSSQIVPQVLAQLPEMPGRQHDDTVECVAHLVDFLATGLYLNDIEVFTRYVTWITEVLGSRGIPAQTHCIRPTLDLVRSTFSDFPRTQTLLAHAYAVLAPT